MEKKEANIQYILNEEIKFLGKPTGNFFVEPKKQVSGYGTIKVELLQCSNYEEWINSAFYATFVTWDREPQVVVSKMMKTKFKAREKKLINMLLERPISVATESAILTFKITGIPRSITHQSVRARKMTFGQESLRVSSCYSSPVRIPRMLLFPENKQMYDKYVSVVIKCREIYKELIEIGIPMEQARNIMPMGITTKLVMVARLRDFIDYLKARSSDMAQDEHRYLSFLLLYSLKKNQPKFYELIKIMIPDVVAKLHKEYGD